MNEQIITLMEQKKYNEARKKILEMNAVDIAEILEELDIEDGIILFRMLPKDLSVEVFSYLSYEQQKSIINMITDKEIQNIMEKMFFDDMIDLLEEMPANIVKKILKHTKAEERELINQFLNYPENSAGSLMTIEYVGLKKEMTVKQAMEYIKTIAIDRETIYTCYVMNESRKLEGIVSLRKLVISDETKTISEIMTKDVIYVHTHDDREDIARVFRKYNFMALPVVDKEDRLIGIITVDDIINVIDQENTEDFQRMAAMEPSDEEYLDTSIFTLAKKRVGWLLFLMISAIFTGNIIQHFENMLQTVVVLTAFMPMLMGTGGNAGSQVSTLVIRGMALGEIQLKDILKVIWKELRVSIIVGAILSSINFVRIVYFEKFDIKIGLVVCITLFFVVILAKIIGGTLPIIAKLFRVDPAIMASPLISTFIDAISLFVYFSLASLILGIG